MLLEDVRFRGLCARILSVRQVPSRSLVLLGRLRSPGHVVCPATFDLPSVDAQSLLSPADDATLPHTGARNSRNRFRMSSTGEELSKYSSDDSQGARAV